MQAGLSRELRLSSLFRLSSWIQAGATAQATSTEPGNQKTLQGDTPMLPTSCSHEECREGLVELHTSFRELLTFFCTNATIHGTIRLVCSRQNRLKTTSWGLLLLGALGALYWQLGLLLEQYWSYPAIMAVSVHSEHKIFPSITLCDMNPHRPSPVRRHLEELDAFAQENIYSLYKFNFSKDRDTSYADVPSPGPSFQLDRRIHLQRLRHLGGQHKVGFRLCNSTGGDCFYRAYFSGVTAAREWYRFHYVDVLALLPTAWEHSLQSHQDFVLSCHYDSEDCQAENFQKFHHQTYGSCYTFKGFWTAQHPGITHGISLVLRAEQQYHLPLLSEETGIKIMIHGHNHTPFLEHRGFSIRPGTKTTIGIREDEVHRLGSPYSHCTDGVEGMDVQLLYNTSYTTQACLVSCFQQLMVENCSCAYYLYPLPAGAQYCSHIQHPAWGHCFYRLYQDLENHRLPCVSRCPRPCRESLYKLSAGTSRWPSTKSADWILAAVGDQGLRKQSWSLSQSHRSSVAKVNIFYQELNYRTVDEAPVYSVPQLLSAMGSLWSLWFGSSVLSVLELLELLLDTTALALLLGFRWLCQSQAGDGTASGLPHTTPETSQLPGDYRHNVRGPEDPAGAHPHPLFPGSPQDMCLQGVLVEELG
ncbi:epithelial sodium channel subunit delta [Castor canadensis]|uniref:Epithelial sodium channel subunit delta n=1 Tax=Castor canadensis TaxID=51338 RepID=A0AC58N7T1_CASCN